ncbi:hypothetical protein NKJ04_17405 [Mesorhizobium sp. M0618]|uniref:hypothetical protein n=1 Tax=Mesorhizobium sp. M0618 TaxID=2956972 RepID=UPI00333C0C4A
MTDLTRAQLEWIQQQCLGPAITYASYAARGGLKPHELERYNTLINPAMDGLAKLVEQAK